MIQNVIAPDGEPIEVARGRGDLRFSSIPSWMYGYGRTIAEIGGKQVSYAEIFATQVWVAAAVNWLLRQSIRVPLKAYRRTGEDSRERLRPDEHPLAKAIVEPWSGGSQYGLISGLLGPLLVHGNGLAPVDQGARNSLRIQPVDWRFALPKWLVRTEISGWGVDLDDDATARTIPADEVLHIAWWSPLGSLGVSPLQQLGTTLKIENAAQRHQESILKNGTRTAAAITADKAFLDNTKPEERELLMANLRQDVQDIYAGPDNSGMPAVLPPGLDWKPAGQTAVEAALIDQRVVSRTETHATYGVAPGVLGLLDSGKSELGEQRQMSVLEGLAPPLILIEQLGINAQIVQGLLRDNEVYVEFDFGGILRGDKLKEIQSLREAISSALMTPNQGKAVLNLPRSDESGMDDHYLPRNNLWPLSVPYPAKGMGGETAQAAAALIRQAAELLGLEQAPADGDNDQALDDERETAPVA